MVLQTSNCLFWRGGEGVSRCRKRQEPRQGHRKQSGGYPLSCTALAVQRCRPALLYAVGRLSLRASGRQKRLGGRAGHALTPFVQPHGSRSRGYALTSAVEREHSLHCRCYVFDGGLSSRAAAFKPADLEWRQSNCAPAMIVDETRRRLRAHLRAAISTCRKTGSRGVEWVYWATTEVSFPLEGWCAKRRQSWQRS